MISKQKATIMLEHLKVTHQYFCFATYDRFYTAEELLAVIKGRPVTFEEAIEYITQ